VLVVTLDPWRDTPKALPFLAKKWELPEYAHVLSGPIDEVLSVLEKYHVPYERNELTGEVTHPALTYIIQKGDTIAYMFNNVPKHWLIQAVQRLESHDRAVSSFR